MSKMLNTKKSMVETRIIAVLSKACKAGTMTCRDMVIIAPNMINKEMISFFVMGPRF